MQTKFLAAAGFLAGLIVAACQTGCSSMGYELGSMLPPEIQTVFIPTVQNNTEEPQIESETTRAIIDAFARDGSLRLAGQSEADSVLYVTLTSYQIVPLAFRRDTRTAAEEYRIYLTASMMLLRNDGSEEVIAQSPALRGNWTFEMIGDLTTSKRIGLPDAAADLARHVVAQVVEYW